MNAGSQRLVEGGWSLATIVTKLALAGRTVSRTTAARWRSGAKTPGPEARTVLARAPFRVPVEAWDVAPSSPDGLSPSRRGDKGQGAPSTGGAGVGPAVSGEALAREYLERIVTWRKAADEAGSDAAKERFARLERGAIVLYLQATGQGASTEVDIGRSPQWARLKAELVAALEQHPSALKAVLATIDRNAAPPAADGLAGT